MVDFSFTDLSPLVIISFRPQLYKLFYPSRLTPVEESKWSN
jgi:hypothetical protein